MKILVNNQNKYKHIKIEQITKKLRNSCDYSHVYEPMYFVLK